jgi:hypothetical protein
MIVSVITENFSMTFPKKGHVESQKFARMEVNQHSAKTLVTHSHAITSSYMHVLIRFGHQP